MHTVSQCARTRNGRHAAHSPERGRATADAHRSHHTHSLDHAVVVDKKSRCGERKHAPPLYGSREHGVGRRAHGRMLTGRYIVARADQSKGGVGVGCVRVLGRGCRTAQAVGASSVLVCIWVAACVVWAAACVREKADASAEPTGGLAFVLSGASCRAG